MLPDVYLKCFLLSKYKTARVQKLSLVRILVLENPITIAFAVDVLHAIRFTYEFIVTLNIICSLFCTESTQDMIHRCRRYCSLAMVSDMNSW